MSNKGKQEQPGRRGTTVQHFERNYPQDLPPGSIATTRIVDGSIVSTRPCPHWQSPKQKGE